MNHADLVRAAAAWAKKRYPVVITEVSSSGRETPDVLAFGNRFSTLIECKASRSDFLADQQKYFRRTIDFGMGRRRYYCAPTGLLKPDEMPNQWGLIEVGKNGKARIVKDSGVYSVWSAANETQVLISVLRRLAITEHPGVSIRCYTHQTKCTATVSIDRDLPRDTCTSLRPRNKQKS